MHLSDSSKGFVCVFVCRKLSPHLEFEITGVCSPYVVSLCDFAYYVFGQEPASNLSIYKLNQLFKITLFYSILHFNVCRFIWIPYYAHQ